MSTPWPSEQHPLRTLLLASLTLLLPLTGCSGIAKQTGSPPTGLVHSSEAEQLFLSRTLLPEHDYYFTGSQNDPEAILAVSRSIHFEQGMWSSIEISQARLNFWMTFIEANQLTCTWYGRAIIAPDGRRVGVYYSRYDYTLVRFPSADTLVVYTPITTDGTFFLLHRNCPDD